MRILTRSEQAGSALRRAVPVVGLSVTVIAGVVLGLWMVSMALRAPAASQTAAAGHNQADSAESHGHPEAGTAEMPGMSAADMATMAPTRPAADAMAGMEPQEMAAMTHSEPAAADSARPLTATLAGFALLNLSVLLAAVVIGRRRKAHSAARPQRRGGPANRGRRETPLPVQSAPVPSAPIQSAPDSAGSLS